MARSRSSFQNRPSRTPKCSRAPAHLAESGLLSMGPPVAHPSAQCTISRYIVQNGESAQRRSRHPGVIPANI
jgi:hypothetical protein